MFTLRNKNITVSINVLSVHNVRYMPKGVNKHKNSVVLSFRVNIVPDIASHVKLRRKLA